MHVQLFKCTFNVKVTSLIYIYDICVCILLSYLCLTLWHQHIFWLNLLILGAFGQMFPQGQVKLHKYVLAAGFEEDFRGLLTGMLQYLQDLYTLNSRSQLNVRNLWRKRQISCSQFTPLILLIAQFYKHPQNIISSMTCLAPHKVPAKHVCNLKL